MKCWTNFSIIGKAKGKKKKEKEEKKRKLKIQKKEVKEEKKKKRENNDDDVTSLEPPMSMPNKPVDPFNQPPPQEAIDMATQMKDRLLAQIEQLGANLPPNTLDQLIGSSGGKIDFFFDGNGRTGELALLSIEQSKIGRSINIVYV
jgi:hypothetical protein